MSDRVNVGEQFHSIITGLNAVPMEGSPPGAIISFGDQAYCPEFDNSELSPVGISIYGNGKVVALGHNGYIHSLAGECKQETPRFMGNVIKWVASQSCLGGHCDSYCSLENLKVSPGYPYVNPDCRLPISIAGIGMDEGAFHKVIDRLNNLEGRQIYQPRASVPRGDESSVNQILAQQPDVILWTNSDCSIELTDYKVLDSRAEALLTFIYQGGGVIVSVCPWGWESLTTSGEATVHSKRYGIYYTKHSDAALAKRCVFNHLLERVGLMMTSDYASPKKDAELGYLLAGWRPDKDKTVHLEHTANILERRASLDEQDLKNALATLQSLPNAVFEIPKPSRSATAPVAFNSVKHNIDRLTEIANQYGKANIEFPLALDSNKIGFTKAASFLYVPLLRHQCDHTAPENCPRAYPVNAFPGDVKGDRVTQFQFTLNPLLLGWQTTGIYAPPGEIVIITLDAGFMKTYSTANLRFKVQLGCHTDPLPIFKEGSDYALPRHSKISSYRYWSPREDGPADNSPFSANSVAATRTSIACVSPYGGLLYLEILEKLPNTPSVPFVIEGGVPILYYNLQKEMSEVPLNPQIESYPHKVKTWIDRKKEFTQAPWGELEGRYIIWTVNLEALKLLDDPDPVLKFWDSVLAHELALSGDQIDRKERIVADREISAGYLHSGYPIMAHLDLYEPNVEGVPSIFDVDGMLKSEQNHPCWGIFHELGHNRQKIEWTFDGTVEVTCNIFSLYCTQMVYGTSPYKSSFYLENSRSRAQTYLKTGQNFNSWKSDCTLALATYVSLIEEIGWKAIADTMRSFKEINPKPQSDEERIKEWIVQTSLCSGQDLRLFYRQWKWPFDYDNLSGRIGHLTKWDKDINDLIANH